MKLRKWFLMLSLIALMGISFISSYAMPQFDNHRGEVITNLSLGEAYGIGNPQDGIIHEKGTHADGKPATDHWSVSHKQSGGNGITGGAFQYNWFDVKLNGTYSISDMELGMRSYEGPITIEIHIQLYGPSNNLINTVHGYFDLNTGSPKKYRVPEGWREVADKNVSRVRVHYKWHGSGETNNAIAFYYINVYRQYTTGDGAGVFKVMTTDKTELQYGSSVNHHMNSYYSKMEDISIAYQGDAANYVKAEHSIELNYNDMIRLTPRQATDTPKTITVKRKETRWYSAAEFTITITRIAKKDITITAKELEVIYGTPIAQNPGQVTADALVEGDSITGITLVPSITNVGIGEIAPSNAIIQNEYFNVTESYNITYTNGVLTIVKKPIEKPVAVTNLVYNGGVQTGVAPASNPGYTYAGSVTATNAGSYSATATLDGNHIWIDETTEPVTINWSIAKKQVTPVLVAIDRLYDGTIEADGEMELHDKVVGDKVFARYNKCTFDSSLVGTWKATATGIALYGDATSNYTLTSTEAIDDANITKAVLTVYVNSNLVNTAQEAFIKEKTAQAAAAVNIKLPASYTIGNANGSYGSILSESYTRSGVYSNALGVIEDTFDSDLVMENIPCVAVTYHITTGQNAVYGDNTTDASEQTTITTYVNSADAWQIVNKARKIATDSPATATLNVYLKEGEHLLVDTAIGVYYGRMDVTVIKVNESTVLAEDKIDAFFPANYTDDFRVSKLNEAKHSETQTDRGDYWKEVKPFTAPSTGVYTFTFTVTGKSYLHSLDTRYTQNLPAQKPVTELLKFTINGTEMHGIDAQK